MTPLTRRDVRMSYPTSPGNTIFILDLVVTESFVNLFEKDFGVFGSRSLTKHCQKIADSRQTMAEPGEHPAFRCRSVTLPNVYRPRTAQFTSGCGCCQPVDAGTEKIKNPVSTRYVPITQQEDSDPCQPPEEIGRQHIAAKIVLICRAWRTVKDDFHDLRSLIDPNGRPRCLEVLQPAHSDARPSGSEVHNLNFSTIGGTPLQSGERQFPGLFNLPGFEIVREKEADPRYTSISTGPADLTGSRAGTFLTHSLIRRNGRAFQKLVYRISTPRSDLQHRRLLYHTGCPCQIQGTTRSPRDCRNWRERKFRPIPTRPRTFWAAGCCPGNQVYGVNRRAA